MLVDLAELKAWLKIDPADTSQDTVLTMALAGAIQMLESALGRTLSRPDEPVVERVDGSGTEVVYLRRYPNVEVQEVSIDSRTTGTPIDELTSWDQLGSVSVPALEDLDTDDEGGLHRLDGRKWPRGRRNVKVTYAGGYTAETFPVDLKLMAFGLARAHLDRREVRTGVESETIGDYSYKLNTEAIGQVLAEGVSVLQRYRQVAL